MALDKSFTNVGDELTINVDDIFNPDFYNDVCVIIGIMDISKTNVMINVSVPITPVGILYNGDICFEGEAYRYGTQIKVIIRNISGAEIDALKVKEILYK